MGRTTSLPHLGFLIGSPGDEGRPPSGIARGPAFYRLGLLTNCLPMPVLDARCPGTGLRGANEAYHLFVIVRPVLNDE